MLTFFAEQLSKRKPGRSSSNRVLVAAHTNVAVDRVLNDLLDQGFTGERAPKLALRFNSFDIVRHAIATFHMQCTDNVLCLKGAGCSIPDTIPAEDVVPVTRLSSS